jgi:hypothetical protein
VDIANGAPSGADASEPARAQLGRRSRRPQPRARHVQHVDNGGGLWTPREVELAAIRGYYSRRDLAQRHRRVARLQRVLEPFKDSAIGRANDRPLIGQVLHATSARVPWAPSPRATAGVRRRARLVAERPRGRVPRRLRLRRGHAQLRHERVERRPRRGGLPRHRPVPPGPPRRGGGDRAADRRGRGAARRERRDEGEDADAPSRRRSSRCVPANFGNSDIFGWSSLAAP